MSILSHRLAGILGSPLKPIGSTLHTTEKRGRETAETTKGAKHVLHVGNISNLAYGNARMAQSSRLINYVVSYDFWHFASWPEWEDLTSTDLQTRVEDFGDPYFPDFWRLKPESRRRPQWFAQGPQLLAIAYLVLLREGNIEAAQTAWRCLHYQSFKACRLRDTMPQRHVLSRSQFEEFLQGANLSDEEREELEEGFRFDLLLQRLRELLGKTEGPEAAAMASPPFDPKFVDRWIAVDPSLRADIHAFRANLLTYACGFEQRELPPSHSDFALPARLQHMLHAIGALLSGVIPRYRPAGPSAEDVAPYSFVIPYWRDLFARFDEVILYGPMAVLGALVGGSYIAYEHGTIRDAPFQDSGYGRLVRHAFEHARHVFITNADYFSATRRIEIAPSRRTCIPHPCEEQRYDELRHCYPTPRSDAPIVFVAPARHDWQLSDPSLSKGNDRLIRAFAAVVAETRTPLQLEFVEWGLDVDASRALIEKLGISSNVIWKKPMPKGVLWREYLLANAVVDQFLISSIAGVSFEALALGRRCITHDDGIANREFFGVQPPLLSAHTEAQIADRLRQVIDDPMDRRGVGRAGRDWIEKYHSRDVTIDKLCSVLL
ncbi:MAG: glycosyltransferase [Acetobacteraceae bacterium]|nr:glycosyltransferase [Acetobacteraceae bacterium]